jgi:UDP-4-amino-4,6-dideoxy-N-acetyl-beta-L-altrosamine transaminase
MLFNSIPYGKQYISDEDINEVISTLRSDFLTQGPKVAEFEQAFAKYVGANYAVAVTNGTAALHLSALALDVKKGDKVITSPITFAASANCIKYCGGEVLFSDIDKDSFLIDLDKIEDLLLSDSSIKGIIPVDFAGNAVDLEKLKQITSKYNCWIIEDACHAPGGYFFDSKGDKQFCGNGNFADLAIFSFHPVKHIATGEGGMITTNNKALYDKLILLRTHGITRDSSLLFDNHGAWYYEMQELGYNYRMTDILCALGISQLKRANAGLERRKAIAKKYDFEFTNNTNVKTPKYLDGHAFHLYILEVNDRLGLYNYLRSKNIFAQIHYIPVHTMPYYKKLGLKSGDYPVSEEYYSKCISLPMYPTLTDVEQRYVIDTILEYFDSRSL